MQKKMKDLILVLARGRSLAPEKVCAQFWEVVTCTRAVNHDGQEYKSIQGYLVMQTSAIYLNINMMSRHQKMDMACTHMEGTVSGTMFLFPVWPQLIDLSLPLIIAHVCLLSTGGQAWLVMVESTAHVFPLKIANARGFFHVPCCLLAILHRRSWFQAIT